MSSARDSFSFDPNEYVRPNDNWVCGGACDGLPCSRGPTSTGECGAPCDPIQVGDRFFCNNAASLAGKCDDGPLADGRCCHYPPQCTPAKAAGGYLCRWGACVDGPLPDGSCSRQSQICRPRRTLKAQRRLVTATVFGCSIGLALLFLGGPGRRWAISPGNVASVHSAIANNCAACHEAGELDVLETFNLGLTRHDATWQNGLCLKCHQEFSQFDRSPHTMPAERLTAPSETTTAGGRVDAEIARSMLHVPAELACANCHREHHGTMHDLTMLSDQQCQMCHQNSFHTFATDHPPFTDYPLIRRSEIYFNHSTHYGVHFANFARTAPGGIAPGNAEELAAASSTSCAACHETDISGAYMVTLGYEKMCSTCHDQQIWDDRVPAMSTLALRVNATREGVGPGSLQVTPGPFDLPPIMHLLLSADGDFANAYPTLRGASWQASAEVLQDETDAVNRLKAAMDRLLVELHDDAHGAIQDRLTEVCGNRLDEETIDRLARVTATADFVSSVDQLAGQLQSEGETAPAAEATLASGNRPVTGWRFDAASAAVVYRPREHADSLLHEWTDAAAEIASPANVPVSSDERANVREEAIQAFAEYFMQPVSAGRCTKCHTVDRAGDRLQVNWHAMNRSASVEELTMFWHAPHIVFLPGEDRCGTCHVLQQGSGLFRSEFFLSGNRLNTDFSHGASAGFSQIQGTAVCANCHNSRGASERCTTCHHYHSRSVESLAAGSPK